MSWAVGYDTTWHRDIGYGVPAWCDHPDCTEVIDRGLSYVCGGEPYGGDVGCGLYFCAAHQHCIEETGYQPVCRRCVDDEAAFDAKPDHPSWIAHKLTHESWAPWRAENPEWVAEQAGASA